MILLIKIREPLNRLREAGKGEGWALIGMEQMQGDSLIKNMGGLFFYLIRVI